MNEPSKPPPDGPGPLIYAISGGAAIVLFGFFLVAHIPPRGSIIPPIAIAVGMVMLIAGLVTLVRRRRRRTR